MAVFKERVRVKLLSVNGVFWRDKFILLIWKSFRFFSLVFIRLNLTYVFYFLINPCFQVILYFAVFFSIKSFWNWEQSANAIIIHLLVCHFYFAPVLIMKLFHGYLGFITAPSWVNLQLTFLSYYYCKESILYFIYFFNFFIKKFIINKTVVSSYPLIL